MIHVHELSYTYPNAEKPAVRSISFQVDSGEIFGFLGPSGAGKSTTQKILIGLLQDYEGQAEVFGQDMRDQRRDYYERIGVSFEFPNHYQKLTALENLEYFRSLYRGNTEEPLVLLKLVGLEAAKDKRVSEFSKGMRMRLSFVRALLNKPQLLFLDEPTAGLDPTNSRRIRELIRRKQAEGTTIFLTTHDMVTADKLCDRVAFIVGGSLVRADAPRTLKQRHGRRTVRVEYETDDRLEQREFPLDSIGHSEEFLALLRSGAIQTIHTQETTLEEVFVQVTGEELT